jgi:penicillin-binding protein 1A
VFGVWPDDNFLSPVIWEAFKPDNEPRRLGRTELLLAGRAGQQRSDAAFLRAEGGIY